MRRANKHNDNRIDNTIAFKGYKEYRRIDSLAKLLTGNSVCTAVAIDKENKLLLVSTNKISQEIASILNDYFSELANPDAYSKFKASLDKTVPLNQDGKKNAILNKKAEVASELVSTLEALKSNNIEILCKHICKNVIDRYLGSNPPLDILEQHTAIKEFLPYFFNQGDFSLQKFQNLIKEEKQIINSYGWSNLDRSKVQNFFDHVSLIIKKIKKIEQILCTDKFPELQEAIQNGNFEIIGPYGQDGNKNAHSEINIVYHLAKTNKTGLWYVGCSKLNCFECHNDIITINTTSLPLKILTRGAHNVSYIDRRVSLDTSFLSKFNIDFYKQYLQFHNQKKSIKKETLEQADYSDSDIDHEDLTIIRQTINSDSEDFIQLFG